MSLVDRFLSTLSRRPSRTGGPLRTETLPPQARRARSGWRQRLGAWLGSGFGEGPLDTDVPAWSALPARPGGLEAARAAFAAALADVESPQAHACLDQIAAARSLHELWHLRSPVYGLVSRCHAQGEANRRMATLDRLFAKRQGRRGPAAFKPRR